VWNSVFVSVRNFESEGNTTMHCFLNLIDTHRATVNLSNSLVNKLFCPIRALVLSSSTFLSYSKVAFHST